MQIDIIAVHVRITEAAAANSRVRPLSDRVSGACWRGAVLGVRCLVGALIGLLLAALVELAIVIIHV